jgi:hypothetical protein
VSLPQSVVVYHTLTTTLTVERESLAALYGTIARSLAPRSTVTGSYGRSLTVLYVVQSS